VRKKGGSGPGRTRRGKNLSNERRKKGGGGDLQKKKEEGENLYSLSVRKREPQKPLIIMKIDGKEEKREKRPKFVRKREGGRL